LRRFAGWMEADGEIVGGVEGGGAVEFEVINYR
jgi:hypothetical protein